jgi:type I restriction enzyme S subunit
MVPEGWEVVRFTDIVDVLSGGTPKTSVSEYWDGDIPWFTPKDKPESFYILTTAKKITEVGLNKCNSKLYPLDTVFITARGTVGQCALAAVPMAVNQTCYALRGRDGLSQYIVFLMTLELVDALKKSATGAVFDTIVVETFRQQRVLSMPEQLREQFAGIVSPIFSLIKTLQQKNSNLRRTRDLLLPRLISGELDVAALEVAGVMG